jgi:hypothetical protein
MFSSYARYMESDFWFRIGVVAVGTLPVALVILMLFYK